MEVDECESSPCFFESTCMDRLNGYVCMCGLGYKGTLCYESVTCDDDPCLNGGVCNYTMDMRTDQVDYFTHIIHAYDHIFCHVLYFNDSSWETISNCLKRMSNINFWIAPPYHMPIQY